MRVISGEYGGRRLKSLPGENTRPTTDKVKESLFNMIGPYFDGGIVLDLYSGSGALAIEAISRGMDKAICIEKNNGALAIIRENIAITKEPTKFEIKRMDAMKALTYFRDQESKFDLVLLDPPYKKQEIAQQLDTMNKNNLLNFDAIIVCETDKDLVFDPYYGSLKKRREAIYGNTKITIFRMERTDE